LQSVRCFRTSSIAEDRFFHRERPVKIFGFYRGIENARILGEVSCAFALAVVVHRLLQFATADRAVEDEPEASCPVGKLILRRPVHAKGASQAYERLRLSVSVA